MKKMFKGVMFDDVTKEDEYNDWSQICQSCVDRHKVDKNCLDDAGQGICGVEGCENESDYYIDFV
jgi:hypothetical protein